MEPTKHESTTETQSCKGGVITRFFNPKTDIPKVSTDDPNFSVDVFIIDDEGMHGLAFYSFKDQKWSFDTDTLVDYDEVGNETEWRWYYPLFTKEDAGL